jgi:hypothetical protein
MVATLDTDEYLEEMRQRLCGRCIVRLPGAPPCAVRGVGCGIERHLAELVDICHSVSGMLIDPFAEAMDAEICARCELRETRSCPCPMKYLLPVAVEAVEAVDRRREERG